jgi:SAM-dependent methyltransferase
MESDLAGKSYWDEMWGSRDLPPPFDPTVKSLRNWVDYGLHLFFTEALAARRRPGAKLLEVGCASSVWLPYFSREQGFTVSGVDYSAVGCDRERALLRREGVAGEVVCEDFFSPSPALHGSFDVVVSNGVVEHFRPTSGCVRAISRYLRPGGLMVTVIPSFAGAMGHLQRLLDREVYDKHVPLSAEQLAAAHAEAGLWVQRSGYLFSVSFAALNFRRAADSRAFKALYLASRAASLLAALVEDRLFVAPPNRHSSPYAICLAEAPLGGAERGDQNKV